MMNIINAYIELCKPRVVLLMLITALCGMLIAPHQEEPIYLFPIALLGIALAASAGAALNHVFDRRIDSTMLRTQNRPVPSGILQPKQVFIFASILVLSAMLLLVAFVNYLTAALTFVTFIAYAAIYTLYLKHATSQNIVIGGIAGAMPPLLGWTAITGQIDPPGLLMVLIIFVWTPPHFWALAIHRYSEYADAKIPMLPVTHGIPYTKLNILLYTVLLFGVSLLPFTIGMSGLVYLIAAVVLGLGFLYRAWILKFTQRASAAMQTFRYSILYLFLLFIFLLIDHYIQRWNL